jgi:hypothetical protein
MSRKNTARFQAAQPKLLDILNEGVENSVEEAASIPDQLPLRRVF